MADSADIPQTYKPSSLALLTRSLGYFKPYVGRVILASAAMLVVGACQAGAAYLVQPALDDIFMKQDRDALIFIPVFFLLLTFAKVGFRVVQNYTMEYCGLKVLETLRDELYKKIIYLPVKFYEDSRIGVLLSRIINDVSSIRSSMPALVMLVRQVVTLGCLMSVVIYRDPGLAFWAVIVLPGAFYPFVYFGRRMRRLSRKGQEKTADVTVILQEIFSGIRVVKAFATEEKESVRFDAQNRGLLRIALKRTLSSECMSSIMEFVGALGIGFVLWFGGLQVINGESTPGTFFSFVAALVMMYEPVKKLSEANITIQNAMAGAERVFDILDSPLIRREKDGTVPYTGPFTELVFDDVCFTYGSSEGEDAPVLEHVRVTVKPGEKIALVGPSGAGKSTLVNLIPRFYDPRSGRILLNSLPLGEYTLSSLRRAIAMVSQDNFLFNLSVRENIAYGHDDISEEAVVAAAKAAYAHEFITALPEGYATVIGERGVKLSGGQRQRLTIARALAKNASLLIMDEATSALDSESERIVQKALDNLMRNHTSIVIAHRLSTILGADRILVMDKGRVVAAGRHEELLLSSPFYARLYAMQFRLEEAAGPLNGPDGADGPDTPDTGAMA